MLASFNFANNKMSVHSKIPLQTYVRTTTAALIDYSIAYIATKMVT